MAMIGCRECKKQISDTAGKCPNCGAKVARKKTSPLTLIFAGVLAFGVIIAAMAPHATQQTTQQAAKAPDPRDGARALAVNAAKMLRDAMKDPSSFELEEALFMDDDSGCYEYFARNSFNARQRGAAIFSGGRIVTSDQPGFKQAWRKHCADKSGEPIGAYPPI